MPIKTIKIDDNTVVVTTANVDENKKYTIEVKAADAPSGPGAAGDTCIIRTGMTAKNTE